ncbi:MAG TPA: hypothetical protein VK816_02215 [Jatrophihabitantaceae bacterium]|nr:hypothetical protein [Jatrophihabitantaceae bacterium]
MTRALIAILATTIALVVLLKYKSSPDPAPGPTPPAVYASAVP